MKIIFIGKKTSKPKSISFTLFIFSIIILLLVNFYLTINFLDYKKIKEMFSNSVMIIDEVHNIKKGVDSALVSPLLETVVKKAENMKLLV